MGIRIFWCARRDLKACYQVGSCFDRLAEAGVFSLLADRPPADRPAKNRSF